MATSIKLDEQLKSRIKQIADIKQRTPHWIMREAIKKYVAKEEAREKFKQEAIESWEAFQETGLHLTGNEVSQWLDTWGTDKEEECPSCHK